MGGSLEALALKALALKAQALEALALRVPALKALALDVVSALPEESISAVGFQSRRHVLLE